MMESQTWVVQDHSLARVTHYYLRFLSFLRLVAVDGAMCAGCFLLLEWAFVQSHPCILQKIRAFRAQLSFSLMFVLAVNTDHGFDSLFLPFDSLMFRGQPISFHVVWRKWGKANNFALPRTNNCINDIGKKDIISKAIHHCGAE